MVLWVVVEGDNFYKGLILLVGMSKRDNVYYCFGGFVVTADKAAGCGGLLEDYVCCFADGRKCPAMVDFMRLEKEIDSDEVRVRRYW